MQNTPKFVRKILHNSDLTRKFLGKRFSRSYLHGFQISLELIINWFLGSYAELDAIPYNIQVWKARTSRLFVKWDTVGSSSVSDWNVVVREASKNFLVMNFYIVVKSYQDALNLSVPLTSLGMRGTNVPPHFQNSSKNYFTSIPCY